MSYTYFSNGFYIQSDIDFPELQPACTKYPDVNITTGKVPNQIASDSAVSFEQISGDLYLLDINKVAKFLIEGTSKVIIEPYNEAELKEIRLYILSTVFSVILFKRNQLTLHASSVTFEGQAFLIAGQSTAGKSSLAFGLIHLGFELLNDDISTILLENDKPFVYPGIARLKLSTNCLVSYGHTIDNFERLSKTSEKFSFPIKRFSLEKPMPIKMILFIDFNEGNEFEVKNLNGIELFALLRENTFRPHLIKELHKSTLHFHQISTLSKSTKFLKISRPLSIGLKEFSSFVKDLLMNTTSL